MKARSESDSRKGVGAIRHIAPSCKWAEISRCRTYRACSDAFGALMPNGAAESVGVESIPA